MRRSRALLLSAYLCFNWTDLEGSPPPPEGPANYCPVDNYSHAFTKSSPPRESHRHILDDRIDGSVCRRRRIHQNCDKAATGWTGSGSIRRSGANLLHAQAFSRIMIIRAVCELIGRLPSRRCLRPPRFFRRLPSLWLWVQSYFLVKLSVGDGGAPSLPV